MNKHSLKKYLSKEIKDPQFKKGYEEEKQKLNLGFQIFRAREKAGLTQSELAKRISTKQSNISRLEEGNYNFTVAMLDKIAAALNVEVEIKLVA